MCNDGDVRLMNGTLSTSSSGRVEVCLNNVYGSVCGVRWDESDAAVVCRQLNMQSSGQYNQQSCADYVYYSVFLC